MFTVIDDKDEAKNAFSLLKEMLVHNCATEEIPVDTSLGEVWWIPTHKIWVALEDRSDTEYCNYYCCYGVAKPEPHDSTSDSIVVQINPPVEGVHPRKPSMFARNDNSTDVHLCHSGTTGGGAVTGGVKLKQQVLLDHCKNQLVDVKTGTAESRVMIDLGPIDETLIERVAHFVRTVKRLKDDAKKPK